MAWSSRLSEPEHRLKSIENLGHTQGKGKLTMNVNRLLHQKNVVTYNAISHALGSWAVRYGARAIRDDIDGQDYRQGLDGLMTFLGDATGFLGDDDLPYGELCNQLAGLLGAYLDDMRDRQECADADAPTCRPDMDCGGTGCAELN